MDIKDTLVELLLQSEPIKERHSTDELYYGEILDIADHLISNGVCLDSKQSTSEEKQATELPKDFGRWIPVADRKPEDDSSVPKHKFMSLTFATVLVCGGAKGVTIANRVNVEPTGHPHHDKLATNGWEWSKGNEDVTHWMPLPEPPREV